MPGLDTTAVADREWAAFLRELNKYWEADMGAWRRRLEPIFKVEKQRYKDSQVYLGENI